jgi:protoporphyrinogen oxidase
MKKKAIIIGGGPAGLTAAYELLKQTDVEPIVIEKSAFWGGISRTIDFKGNKIDIGGHRFFSKSDWVMNWWQNIFPIETDQETLNLTYHNEKIKINRKDSSHSSVNDKVFLIRKRLSRIYYQNKFFQYPISISLDTIIKLGIRNSILIGMSYFKSLMFPLKNEKTLEDFFINRFGKRLYQTFFKDYTEKVWGVKCAEISHEWGAQRIKGLSFSKAFLHFFKNKFYPPSSINQKGSETSLIEFFLYPKFGPGQLWDEVADQVKGLGGVLLSNHTIDQIHISEKKVVSVRLLNNKTDEKLMIDADYIISTMPVSELIQSIKGIDIPSEIIKISEGLIYRNFIMVGILCDKLNWGPIDDNWIYVQDPNVKVGRIQIFNNWSPFMVSDPSKMWIGLEYFCYENDDIWNLSDDDLKELAIKEMLFMGMIERDDFIDGVVVKMPKTYPAYFGSYDRFKEVRCFLDQFENLFLVGRNGMHKYNNQDHSMLTALEAVKNIKNNIKDKSNIWSVNTEVEYHEEK